MEASGRRDRDVRQGQTLAQPRTLDPEESLRIEALRKQRELERKLKEQMIWRKASEVPTKTRENVSGKGTAPARTRPSHTGPKMSGFFRRIRLGRLLDK